VSNVCTLHGYELRLQFAEPGEKCDANVVREYDHQHNYGVSGQASWRVGHHRIAAGAAWDSNGVTFQQTKQFGYLNADRISITTIPFYADGSPNSNGVPLDKRVNLHGTVNTPGIFATDAFTINKWTFTVSGRYNHEHLQNYDRIPGFILGAQGRSVCYNILFLVSGGNVPAPLDIPDFVSWTAFEGASPADRERVVIRALNAAKHERTILSPAESLNAVTVGRGTQLSG
jgi:hypothetical protein